MEFTVLIIDDNRLAVEALRKTIPWTELGLRLIGSACNGVDGKKIILEQRPDIVLSDIQMPELDGLHMMEQLADELAGSRVIFITAYEKIEYASRAIKLSAFDFILKPIDDRELCDSLLRAKQSLLRERDEEERSGKLRAVLQRTRLLAALTQGYGVTDGSLIDALSDTRPDSYFLLVAETQGGFSGPALQRLDFIAFPRQLDIVTALVNGDIVLYCGIHGEAVWQSVARSVAASLSQCLLGANMAVSDPHTEPSEFRIAYEQALQTLLYHHIYEQRTELDFYCTMQSSTVKHTWLKDAEQICSKLAQKVDTIGPDQVWETILEKSGGRLRLIKVMLMFFCTKVMQDKMSSSKWSNSLDIVVCNLTKFNTELGARRWVDMFFEEIRTVNVPASTSLVRSVLEYVKMHVTEGLVLEDVAEQFYVSPNYLSTLIRKQTGQTYRQFVIEAKMDMAKQLLNDTRMRVEDIAYAIGYENYISFYNIFKKLEHVSPSEYRLSKRSS